jgi:transposase
MVVGIDPHKKTHTAVAIDAATARVVGEITVPARLKGHERLLAWVRGLDAERTFAVEDCRHVSGSLERFLIGRGETTVRVHPKLMASSRRSARTRGKSDPIDATAVARAALREPDLPKAVLAGVERDVKLLVDHRETLVSERTRIQNRLRWHLHDIDPEIAVPTGGLDRYAHLDRLEAQLGGLDQTVEVRLARSLVARCRDLTREAKELEREIDRLVRPHAPELLARPGCGALTAAKIVGEVAGISRFSSHAKLALHAGVAPLEVSSGGRNRHRLNRTGNRQLNSALHRIAVTQGRVHPPARAFLERKQAEGHSRREALRCLKRHLARVIYHSLNDAEARRAKEASSEPTTQPDDFPAVA